MRRAIQESGSGGRAAWSGMATPSPSLSSTTSTGAPTDSSAGFAEKKLGSDGSFSGATLAGEQEPEPIKIDLSGAPKWELILLALALYPKSPNWDRILHAEEIKFISHPGVNKVFEKASTLAGQSGLPFDNLFVLITNEIRNPDLLTVLIRDLPTYDSEREGQLLADCLRKVRIHHLDIRINQLAQELKQEVTQEKWEELATLKKDRIRWLSSPGVS